MILNFKRRQMLRAIETLKDSLTRLRIKHDVAIKAKGPDHEDVKAIEARISTYDSELQSKIRDFESQNSFRNLAHFIF